MYNRPFKELIMYQRRANMKPASMSTFDDPTIRLSSLIKFVRAAQHSLEKANDVDSAVTFECFGDFLELDYKPGTPFVFDSRAIGQ